MAKSCSTCGEKFQGQCDACRLVDGDLRIKPVFHCADCNAYLCANCNENWVKRPIAASIQYVNNITDKITNYWNLKFGKTDNVIIIAETTTIKDNLSYIELKTERKRLLKKRNQSTTDEKEKGEIFTALLAIDEKIKAIYSALPQSTKGGGDYNNRDLNSEQTNNFLS